MASVIDSSVGTLAGQVLLVWVPWPGESQSPIDDFSPNPNPLPDAERSQQSSGRREPALPPQASEFFHTWTLDSKNFGPSFEEKLGSILEPLVLFAPMGFPQTMVRRCVQEWEKESNLDGMTFFREGSSKPLGLRMIQKGILQPIRWMLEIPGQNGNGWHGWSNQVGEWVGNWWFGVGNKDPFFPLRILKTELLKGMRWQSCGDMFFLEMLAKVHFLGARLMEKPIPPGLGPVELTTRDPSWFEEAWNLAMFPQFRTGSHFAQPEKVKEVG